MATVKDNLIAARALIDTPEKWGKGPHPDGHRVCAIRAVERVCGLGYYDGNNSPEGKVLQSVLDDMLGQTEAWFRENLGRRQLMVVGTYNDLRSTTHADIMALFDRAIEAQK